MTANSTLPPYALAMGMRIDSIDDDGAPIIAMDYSERAEGRPGFLHGGGIGGLLEMAAYAALHTALGAEDAEVRIKPVNISIEYLRAGQPQTIWATGHVLRAGRRVANVQAEAWQDDRSKPVASCWVNFLLKPR
jgi:uncharacterized protein (TIGR00369 family)